MQEALAMSGLASAECFARPWAPHGSVVQEPEGEEQQAALQENWFALIPSRRIYGMRLNF